MPSIQVEVIDPYQESIARTPVMHRFGRLFFGMDESGRGNSRSASRLPAATPLDAFSPPKTEAKRNAIPIGEDLWTADAIHRSSNFAQMAKSLSRIDPSYFDLFPGHDFSKQAEVAADIYAELGKSDGQAGLLPCSDILEQLARSLIAMFAGTSVLDLQFAAADIAIDRDRRRALILIASELLINALKYAFPDGAPGTIVVDLSAANGEALLIIADNGAGMTSDHIAGSGHGIVRRMTDFLGGELAIESRIGMGTRLAVSFPLSAEEKVF